MKNQTKAQNSYFLKINLSQTTLIDRSCRYLPNDTVTEMFKNNHITVYHFGKIGLGVPKTANSFYCV